MLINTISNFILCSIAFSSYRELHIFKNTHGFTNSIPCSNIQKYSTKSTKISGRRSIIDENVYRPSSTSLVKLRSASSDYEITNISSSIDTNDDDLISIVNPKLMEIDVQYGTQTELVYDEATERYITIQDRSSTPNFDFTVKSNNYLNQSLLRMKNLFLNSFLPDGVTPNYYSFIQWRILQRFINAIVHVLGTQSLLMSLGKSTSSVTTVSRTISTNKAPLALVAALNWVLKDALGKIVRMLWAAKMGRKFDPDAKRWRFRSSLLFALGNGLEIGTYIYPHLFLLLATLANSAKQMSMLTNSATRNALYNSFRDGSRENIGDITAKGEAQIAVVDLLGILTGVTLSRYIGVKIRSILILWITLQILEITCVYKSIRSVIFRMLNFERLSLVVESYLNSQKLESSSNVISNMSSSSSSSTNSTISTNIPTPEDMARYEKIFLPPKHLSRRAISFGSLGRAKLSPLELSTLINIFHKEKYILVIGKDIKNKKNNLFKEWKYRHLIDTIIDDKNKGVPISKATLEKLVKLLKQEAAENCHIVLHVDANKADIVKSTLALFILRQKLVDSVPTVEELSSSLYDQSSDIQYKVDSILSRRSHDCFDMISETKSQSSFLFPLFLHELTSKGWTPPSRFMFGRVSMRAQWPIMKSGSSMQINGSIKSNNELEETT